MMKSILFVFALVFHTVASAGCESDYQKMINDISSKMNSPRATVIANLGAQVIVVGTLSSVGLLTLGGALSLPAVAAGAGSYLTYLSIQKKQYTNALLTIKQSEASKGPRWDKFLKTYKKHHPQAQDEEIREAILRLNAESAFCQMDPYSGKTKLKKLKQIHQLVRAELQ